MTGKIPHALYRVFLLLLVLQPFVVKSRTVKLESPPDRRVSSGSPDNIGRPTFDLEAANHTLSGGRWYHFPMTYGFYSTPKCCQGMERQDVAFAIIDAFTEWENAVPKLNFQWLYPGDDADIRIRFTSLSPPYYGFGYYQPDGRLLLDISRTLWSTSSNPVPYKLDLQSESMHEIGHTLGLEHTNDLASVMYPTLSSGTIKRELTQLDINNIRALYRSKPHHELANSL